MELVIKFQTNVAGKLRNQRHREAQHKAEQLVLWLLHTHDGNQVHHMHQDRDRKVNTYFIPCILSRHSVGMLPFLYKETQLERSSNSKFLSLDHLFKLNYTI